MRDARRVWLPIRYGRLSPSRSNTYTMVFSTRCYRRKPLGTGWVIPCQRDVACFDDLLDEVCELAGAEGLNSWTWGAVALLKEFSHRLPPGFLGQWRRYFASKTRSCRVIDTHLSSEWPALGKSGALRIRWPQPVEGPRVELDLLLATPTEPTIIRRNRVSHRYPSAQEVGAVFAKRNYPDYFINNIRNGITTPDDPQIWTAMIRIRPNWKQQYSDVAQLLAERGSEDVSDRSTLKSLPLFESAE